MKIALIDEHCSSPIVKMAEIKKKKKTWNDERRDRVRSDDPNPLFFPIFH